MVLGTQDDLNKITQNVQKLSVVVKKLGELCDNWAQQKIIQNYGNNLNDVKICNFISMLINSI